MYAFLFQQLILSSERRYKEFRLGRVLMALARVAVPVGVATSMPAGWYCSAGCVGGIQYRSESGPLNSSGVFKCKLVPETLQDVDNSRACLAADKHTRRYTFILSYQILGSTSYVRLLRTCITSSMPLYLVMKAC